MIPLYLNAPSVKGLVVSSNQIVHLSICLFVCPSVCNSVPSAYEVQYLKFGWSHSNQTLR